MHIAYNYEVSNYERTKVRFLNKIDVYAYGKVDSDSIRGIKNKTNESKRLIGFMENDEFLCPNTEGVIIGSIIIHC